MNNKIKVIITDDSAVTRGLFARILDSDPGVEVIATASDGKTLLNLLKREGTHKLNVDVVTLDIQMVEMDGLEALPQALKLRPDIKVIMVSSLTDEGSDETVKALSLGAADFLTKPVNHTEKVDMLNFSTELLKKVKELGGQKHIIKAITEHKKPDCTELVNSGAINLKTPKPIKPKILAIGSSTGGPQALTDFFERLKGKKINIPILITQHMPAQFTGLMAQQLKTTSGLDCIEGTQDMIVEPGKVYIAPGDYHMTLKQEKGVTKINLNQNAQENYCRPAVDVMFRSIADIYGGNVIVIIFTGMGADGLLGSKIISDKGGAIIAQDEVTSVVWGMPGAVAKAGICTAIKPLKEIPDCLIKMSGGAIS